MKKIHIVAIFISPFANGKEIAKQINGKHFDNTAHLFSVLLTNLDFKNDTEFDDISEIYDYVTVLELNEFIHANNEGEITVDDYWLAQVTLTVNE